MNRKADRLTAGFFVALKMVEGSGKNWWNEDNLWQSTKDGKPITTLSKFRTLTKFHKNCPNHSFLQAMYIHHSVQPSDWESIWVEETKTPGHSVIQES